MTRQDHLNELDKTEIIAQFRAEIEARVQASQRTQSEFNAFSCFDDRASTDYIQKNASLDKKVLLAKPLIGESITIKDSFHVPGLPRRHGSATHPAVASEAASVPVGRVQDAGAVIIGKTTMPDYGLLAAGVSSAYGITRNPWNPAMSPGGSSSGAGVTVATGAATFALGTDIAGSVRLPAAHCGISALKPTQGVLAYAPASTWRSAGPMARSISEVRRLFSVIAGANASDQLSHGTRFLERPSAVDAPVPLRGSKVGVWRWPGYGPHMDEATGQLFERAVDLLRQQGAVITEIPALVALEDFEALDRCLQARCLAELDACAPELRDSLLAEVAAWARPGRGHSASGYVRDFEHLSAVASRLNLRFDEFDLIVSPVMGVHAFPAENFGPELDQPLLYHTNFTAWLNQTGQPAASIPMGFSSDEMPVGLQLIGRHGADLELLAQAEAVETLLDVRPTYPELL